jgi:hypothetical protein
VSFAQSDVDEKSRLRAFGSFWADRRPARSAAGGASFGAGKANHATHRAKTEAAFDASAPMRP